ncbi:hypothetical protein H310_07306 [Aphanomyces invadans]|uniref:AAA+ ATPase domain-containing protein n=1 Tax=Aphanomyces invadans TaxID=157072 RepID=A0A024U3E9_9STRA|nr:hypothetical protein H310_07306 [Aphanomyces invadans]ETW00765.1 hypothetical protein H310_07306 [Aphanomyces invadans]|eukprot:XP_008870900.1 hypothetical protein H310_07306 [Aphanomyces invadans]
MSSKRRRTDSPSEEAHECGHVASSVVAGSNVIALSPGNENDASTSSTVDGPALLAELDHKYAFLSSLVQEFRDELNVPSTAAFASDQEWFWFMEMKFFITFLHQMSYMELALSSTKPDSLTHFGQDQMQKNRVHQSDRDEMIARLTFMGRLLEYVSWVGATRLAITSPLPRVHRLAKEYDLTPKELDLFQLMVIFQGCQSTTVRSQLIEEDVNRKMMMFQRLACISEIDMEEFVDDNRVHVKEGTVIAEVDNYTTVLSLSSICVRVCLGRSLTPNHMLKVSQTALEDLLRAEGCNIEQAMELVVEDELVDDGAPKHRYARESMSPDSDGHHGSHHEHGHRVAFDDDDDAIAGMEDSGSSDEKDEDISSFIGSYKKNRRQKHEQPDAVNGGLVAEPPAASYMPYNPDNQLEYLEDRFQVVAFAIRASGARVKDQMKEAGTKQPWGESYGNPMTAGRRELKAKQRMHDRKVMHRLMATRAGQIPLPRLEEMATKFKLNTFEQNVIVMLIGKTISPVLKNLLEGVDTSAVQRMDESITVNQILSVFCDTFQEQVAHRVFFYKSARLLQRGLVKLNRGRWHASGGDLVDQRVELDRRVLDWVVGLDTEINELVEGSDLYNPKVQLSQVVLPDEYKQTILSTVTAYEHFRTYRKTSGLDQTLSYGTGLVLLLCGASGTGKTMTVNAVAHHLKKRVLLVDFPSLQGKASQDRGGECDADLRGLFREADMSNAILFFDECESIFKQREMGGDRLLNALLTEMERYEGIVFLATNRPFDLDEAMHRRITAVFEYKAPDHIQRREIWRVLVSGKLKCSPDIDWDAIALKYELSGGFIKNAILSALLKAIGRNATDPVISHEDIVTGCALQMRGSLHMKTFDHRVVPTTGLDALIVADTVRTTLAEVVQFEKARNVIYGQWNFDFGLTTKYNKKNQKGISVLLIGPSGVGKISAAKAIGFEVGRPLKLVHFAQLQCDSAADTRRALQSTFDDARLMDAVLVLEGFEMFGMDAHGQVDADSPRFRVEAQRLMDMVDTFPGIAILVATTTQSVTNLDHEFSRRLKFLIEMRPPTPSLRTLLWRSFFPPTAPLAADVDFDKLGMRFELSNDAMSNAVFRAAAVAALRPEDSRHITMKDLVHAAELEKKKGRNNDMRDRLFV